jgi:cytochrome c biogenesis protein CcmG/thiol:disulfide interchange protein DsbE
VRRLILWLPLALFLLFAVVVALTLKNPSQPTIRSQMVGKPLPEFALPSGVLGKPGLSRADFADGKPRILNIFASWCIPCMAEAPQLMELKRRGIRIDAIAIRDKPEDIKDFLARWGDPYERIGSDVNSAVQLAIGSSGVPESFIVDGRGIIRYQHIGDIRAEQIPEIIRQYEAAR